MSLRFFLFLVTLAVCATVNLQAQFPMAQDLVGPQVSASFGSALCGCGDIDGDGLPDLIVGAPDFGGVGGAAVYSGVTGALLRFHPGSQAASRYGYDVAGIGDFDGDGTDDYAIGEPFFAGAFGTTGRVEVRSGADASLIISLGGENPEDRFGWALDAAGDVNGDGFADLIVGASHFDGPLGADQGRAYIFLGPLGTQFAQLTGEAPGDLLGAAVAGIGDRDQDQRDEVLIGARWSDGTGINNVGRSYVFDPFDDLVTWSADGEIGGDQYGVAVDGGRDVDADGVPDFVIGAMQNDYLASGNPAANVGRAYVYSGATGSLLFTFIGETAQDHLGASVALVDDMNGDGHADIALGGLTFPLGPGSGLLRIQSGSDGTQLMRRDGDLPGDFYGYSVSALGDVDGDGIPELMTGAPNDANDLGIPGFGRVEVLRLAGAVTYHSSSGQAAALQAEWIGSHFANEATRGLLQVSGAASLAGGLAAASLRPDDFATGGIDVLIDIDDPYLVLTSSFGFDVAGDFYLDLNLRQPALDGISLFVQFLETGPVPRVSNALGLSFTR